MIFAPVGSSASPSAVRIFVPTILPSAMYTAAIRLAPEGKLPERFFLWELFRVRVFFGRSVHDLFCFGDRRIVRRHAYRQAGQEHRQQKQHRNQAFHKIPPVQI